MCERLLGQPGIIATPCLTRRTARLNSRPSLTKPMANSRSAQKRSRQSLKRAADNRSIKTRVRSARRALNEAISAGDKDAVGRSMRHLASAADKAAKRGVIHKNAASRLKRVYAGRIQALS